MFLKKIPSNAFLTGFPLGPSSPGGPLGPAGPADPGGPASPFSPLSPLGPYQRFTYTGYRWYGLKINPLKPKEDSIF